jgi:hypothetical protein
MVTHTLPRIFRGTEEALTDSRPSAAALAKAEAWHWQVANEVEGVWDQEALVYLRSRGQNCAEQITALVERWKEDERATLDEYQERRGASAGSGARV